MSEVTATHEKAGQDFIPVGFNEANIGEVVVIQIFDRNLEVKGEIHPDTLQKFVGILQLWSFQYGEISFLLNGGHMKVYSLEHYHVELFQK